MEFVEHEKLLDDLSDSKQAFLNKVQSLREAAMIQNRFRPQPDEEKSFFTRSRGGRREDKRGNFYLRVLRASA